MLIIGIGGVISSGKSYISSYIERKYDFFYINADFITKELFIENEVIEFVKHNIPKAINDNKVITTVIREEIFNDQDLYVKYSNFMWNLISNRINTIIDENRDKNIIIEAAILSGLEIDYTHKILVYRSGINDYYEAFKGRGGSSYDDFKKIYQYQVKQITVGDFDYKIDNTCQNNDISNIIDQIIDEIT